MKAKPKDEIEFRDPPPRGVRQGVSWPMLLEPLLKHKGRWAMIRTYDTPQQAMDAQRNLHKRNVHVPEPTHEWSFSARGCELFANYRGPKNPAAVRPKRATAKK